MFVEGEGKRRVVRESDRMPQLAELSVSSSPRGTTVWGSKSYWLRPLSVLLVTSLLLLNPLLSIQTVRADDNIVKYAIKRVMPAYPPLAKDQRMEGTVIVKVKVDNRGKVTATEFVRGNIVFKPVSLDAAKRWEFKVPNGNDLEGIIPFVFKLDKTN